MIPAFSPAQATEVIYVADFEEEVGVTAVTPGRWAHCNNLNLNYDEARCGEGGAGTRLAQASEFGPFMCGVCRSCIDSGACTFTDIMIVTGNVGNFLLGIVGSIALLLFVLGGIFLLTSQGEKGRVTKGNQMIFAAAVGIAITLGAVLILRTVLNIATTGSPGSGSGVGIVCDGTNEGETCGENRVCTGGACTDVDAATLDALEEFMEQP